MNTIKFQKPTRMTIFIENDFLKKYKKYCVNNDTTISEKVRLLMEQDFKKNNPIDQNI